MTDARPLAVQSFCFRGFDDNRMVASKVKAIGLTAIELCGKHANFGDPATFDKVLKTYGDAGVQIVSIGVQGFANDAAKETPYFEFAKKAGCTTISASFSPDCILDGFKTAEKLADQYGVNLAIHNHGGRHWLGNSQILQWVFKNTGPRIGLMLDTAWAIDSGEDPVALAEKFGERLYGIHAKDFVYNEARKHKDVVVGTGILDLPGLFAAMKKVGFKGNVIIEYEGDVENPVPALSKCVEAISKAYP